MATSFQILRFRLSDGSLTVNLLSTGTSGYALQENGYAPRTAAPDESSVAVVPFEDVQEEIRFNVYAPAGDAATMRGLMQTANDLFRHAEINDKSGFGPALLFEMQLAGGVLMTARVRQADPKWSDDFNDLLVVEEAAASVQFVRTGWLLNATPNTATSAGVTTSAVAEMLFSSSQRAVAPVKVSIPLFTQAAIVPTSLLVWSDQASNNGLRITEAELSTATGWTSVVDPITANSLASGGNLLRYTPSSTAESLSGAITQPGKPGIVSVFAILRSNVSGGAVTWNLRLAQKWGIQNVTRYGETRILEGSKALAPTVFYLGDVTLTGGETLHVAATASTLTGSPVLDFDVFVLLNRSYGNSGAVQIGGGWLSDPSFTMVFDDRSLTDRAASPRPGSR